MVLPLEVYEESYQQSQTIEKAQFILESKCMLQYGFSFNPTVETNPSPITVDASNMARRYGLANLATAEADGYQVDPSGGSSPSEPALSQAEKLVLTGSSGLGQPGNNTSAAQTYNGKAVPAGGCSGQAQRQIGQLPQNLLADQLDGMSLTASQGNAAVVAAIGKWSACMKTHGFTVSSPYDASQLSGQLGAAPGSDLDRTIAVDDVKCKQSTSLVDTWFKIEAQLQNQYIAAHQQALHDQQTDLDNAVKNAETIATH